MIMNSDQSDCPIESHYDNCLKSWLLHLDIINQLTCRVHEHWLLYLVTSVGQSCSHWYFHYWYAIIIIR